MIIHLYVVCWNEEAIIPFFLQNYQEVDKIVVSDNESTDRSVELYLQHEKVCIRTYKTNGQLTWSAQVNIKNNIWKESRGQADWVIIVDNDELIYHPQGLHYALSLAETEGATLVIPKGIDMVSETFPDKQFPIFDQVKFGFDSPGFYKQCIFKPDEIEEIDFGAGAHTANPVGNVKIATINGLQLRHCKFLSYEYRSMRSRLVNPRVAPEELAAGLSVHYHADEAKLQEEWTWVTSLAKRVVE